MSKEQLPEQQNNIPEEFGNEDYNADIDTGSSAVAAGQTSNIMGIIVVIILVIAVIYFLFSGESEKSEEELEKESKVKVYDPVRNSENADIFSVAPVPDDEIDPVIETITPDENTISDVVELEIPELPELSASDLPNADDFGIEPEFEENDLFTKNDPAAPVDPNNPLSQNDVTAPNLPVPTSGIPSPPEGEVEVSQGEEATPMILMNGGNEESANSSSTIPVTAVETATATRIEFPNRTIAQGKLIDSVLETAINTDFEGKVRAIVSRDTYADFGRAVLIPKGSRLIGSYSGSAVRGQTRVLITWERLIRPDAIDIMINSPATDQFGRSGVPGAVDNKYLELFNNSILLSLITIGSAMAIEESTNSSGVTEETQANGDEKTTAKPSDLAAQEIINTISDTAKTVLEGILGTNPTITIPHGTRIKIFVNQDLIFPKEVLSSGNDNGVIFIK